MFAAILLLFCAASLHAAAPLFSALLSGSGQDYATSVASDAQGNVYVVGLTYSPDFPVTAGALQTKFGGTSDAFIAKLGPGGNVIWSTYLGGTLDDWATGVALDASGNVLVAGYTRSFDFPLAHPIQSVYNNGVDDDYDAFVAKLDPNGAMLLYSTYLGGNNDDGAAGIAVDASGDAIVAITSFSATGFPGLQSASGGIVVSKLDSNGALIYSFLHPGGGASAITLDAAGSIYVSGTTNYVSPGPTPLSGPLGSSQALVFKLSADGTKKLYETTLSGSSGASASAIAVDNSGSAWVAGSTASVDFPLVHPLQSTTGARPVWRTQDSATTWTPLDNLPFAQPKVLAADPGTPTTLYEATGDLGIFKSLDGGASWTQSSSGIPSGSIQALAVDPVHPQTLYAAVTASIASPPSSAVYKSVNGAASWTVADTGAFTVSQLAVDAQNDNIVWEVGPNLRKSVDGGATWQAVTFPGGTVAAFALDPRVSGGLFAVSQMVFCGFDCSQGKPAMFYSSTDGGVTWTQQGAFPPAVSSLTVDASTNPSTIYGISGSGGYRSVDGGATWTALTLPPHGVYSVGPLAVDPSGALYLVATVSNQIFVSHDHAQTWTPAGSFLPAWPEQIAGPPSIQSLVPAGSTGSVYATIKQVAAAGFITKLSPDGATILFSSYLRGHASMEAFFEYLAEPTALWMQNAVTAIALDAHGNATVAGMTRAIDLPVAAPAQAANAGLADAFVTTIASDGSQILKSTYFGGSGDDGALAAALDSQGNLVVAGQTWSYDFPFSGSPHPPYQYGDAFVVRLPSPGPPVISSVVNGASFQSGIEAGSWVTILGSNLAGTFPGRTWRGDEIVGGRLPTALDGVSVTIDGSPAFVEYVSPQQINVQAPSDAATGNVSVVVNNNGVLSSPAPAQLQAVAPAFFTYTGTNYAEASRYPDYAPVANPAVVPGTVAAKPGDVLTLWGTGFGATTPAVPAGTVVTGAPVTAVPPTVTVGGVAAAMIGAALSADSVGLYQVAIQLPANVPTGVVALQASVSGFQAEALLYVAAP